MSRILLVDDSPHAQRMGERILGDEGYEVVTVSNADAALIRLDDVDPDVVLADTVMPGRTGYDICQYLKMSPRHRHVRVILTAGALEPFDEEQSKRAEADATLKKPFEASALLAAVKPLAEAAAAARVESAPSQGPGVQAGARGQARQSPSGPGAGSPVPFVTVVDAEQVHAAVTVALDAAMGTMVDEITGRVLAALNPKKHEAPAPAPPQPEPPQPAEPPPAEPRVQPVRRVSPLRMRAGSILGLDFTGPEPEAHSGFAEHSGFTEHSGLAEPGPWPLAHSGFAEPAPPAPDPRPPAPDPSALSGFAEPDPRPPDSQ